MQIRTVGSIVAQLLVGFGMNGRLYNGRCAPPVGVLRLRLALAGVCPLHI
jgi:hypothetical protein